MTAVDTNVVIRLLTADDARQSSAARKLFASESIWIAKTVVLEAAWVLRSLYKFSDHDIYEALSKLIALDNVETEDGGRVVEAIGLGKQGIDFADALHLTSRPDAAKFVSFDKQFVKRAQRAGVPSVTSISI